MAQSRDFPTILISGLGFGMGCGAQAGALVGTLPGAALANPGFVLIGGFCGAVVGGYCGLVVGLVGALLLGAAGSRRRFSTGGARWLGALVPGLTGLLVALCLPPKPYLLFGVLAFAAIGAPFGAWRAPRVLYGPTWRDQRRCRNHDSKPGSQDPET